MIRSLKIRGIIIALSIIFAIIYLVPSVTPNLPQFWKKIFPANKIHLGLDLQGGMHLILEVETDEALKANLDRYIDDFKETLKQNHIKFEKIIRKGLNLEIISPYNNITQIRGIIADQYKNFEIIKDTQNKVIISFTPKYKKYLEKYSVEQAVETIRNRIDQFGVTEPEIRALGERRILVELPGIKDPDRALKIIGKTARLEFKLVNENISPQDIKNGKIPEDCEVLYKINKDEFGKIISKTPIVVYKKVLLTGEYIKDARVQIDTRYNEPYVAIEFDSQGAKIFDKITAENVGRKLAIILDNNVYSAPVIQERISGGRASITGRFTTKEAHDLAIVLRAGALPAPVKILEKRTVGPSLGKDSIKKGFFSMVIGGAIVLVFMIFYYGTAGIIADIALIFNLILILACLAAFEATLTLPGIAGIILTIGMAVDGNVLIFERIREELRLKKPFRGAVENGFSRAFLTIVDANVTTLIAAIVLYQYGTGPIKGFAVTLSIGIITSIYTGVFVSRFLFDLLLQKRSKIGIGIRLPGGKK